jgi:hypothetical protein
VVVSRASALRKFGTISHGSTFTGHNAQMLSSLLFALVTLALPLGQVSAQDEPPTPAPVVVKCVTCTDQGYVDCKRCNASECSSEPVLFCSQIAACETCEGAGREPCTRCDIEPAQTIAERKLAVAEWRKQRTTVDQFMERELVHVESEHFVLTYDIKGLKPSRKKMDVHGGAHLYLERLEAFHRRFATDLGVEEKHWFGKTQVMMWRSAGDQVRASLKYTRQESDTASKLMGAAPVVSIYYDKSHLHEEFELHQAVLHHVAHCLLSNCFDGIWPGNIRGGWIDGGLAHAYEVELFAGVRHYCYVESDTMGDFKFGAWERSVLSEVKRGKELSFLDVTSRNTADMTPEQHMFAWSFVDFVRKAHPDQLGPLARGIKKKEPIAALTKQLFSMSPFEFHEAWRAWVEETYSSRKKK